MIENCAFSTWREYFVVEKVTFNFKDKNFKYYVYMFCFFMHSRRSVT